MCLRVPGRQRIKFVRFWALSTAAAASMLLSECRMLSPAIMATRRRSVHGGAFAPIAPTTRQRKQIVRQLSVIYTIRTGSTDSHDGVLDIGGTSSTTPGAKDGAFLHNWQSSAPERYASLLGLTPEEVQDRKQEHSVATQALHDKLSSLQSSDGIRKHQLVCEHRYQHGKHPFVCRFCWSYLPICVCPKQKGNDGNDDRNAGDEIKRASSKISLPPPLQKVVLWTHHREWGSVSNSGSLLPLLLDDTKLYMKGLVEHDEEFQRLLVPPVEDAEANSNLVIVLWPDNDTTPDSTPNEQQPRNRKTWDQILEIIANNSEERQRQRTANNNMNVTLLAMEGTWRTARRMAAKLPPHVIRVALPPDAVYWNKRHTSDNSSDTNKSSNASPKMRQQDGGSQDNLCTAEAVTAALVGLGMSKDDGDRILELLQTKVERTHRYQGKQPLML